MRLSYSKQDLGKSFGLAVAVMLLAQVVLSVIFLPFADAEGNLPDVAFWLMQATYTLCIGATAFIYSALTKTNFVSATKFKCKPPVAHILWGCIAVLFLVMFMLPVNDWLMTLIERAGLSRPSVDMPQQLFPMLLVACVLPSFTEEIVFRGTVAQSLATNKNKLASLAVVGGLFAVFHMNPAQTVHQFVLGAFLTLLVFRSGSIWTSVAVHFFNNLLAVVLTFVIVDEAVFVNNAAIFLPIGLVGFSASVFGYFKTTKSCWQTAESKQSPAEKTTNIVLAVSVLTCVAMWIINLLMK